MSVLNEYKFPGDDIPIIKGSALESFGRGCGRRKNQLMELMEAIDTNIPSPVRDKDKPFLDAY